MGASPFSLPSSNSLARWSRQAGESGGIARRQPAARLCAASAERVVRGSRVRFGVHNGDDCVVEAAPRAHQGVSSRWRSWWRSPARSSQDGLPGRRMMAFRSCGEAFRQILRGKRLPCRNPPGSRFPATVGIRRRGLRIERCGPPWCNAGWGRRPAGSRAGSCRSRAAPESTARTVQPSAAERTVAARRDAGLIMPGPM